APRADPADGASVDVNPITSAGGGGCHRRGRTSAYAGAMRSKSRVLTVAAVAVVPLLLVTACGGDGTDAGSTNNLTPITGSSYVTIEPATTTTTTTLAPGETPDGAE